MKRIFYAPSKINEKYHNRLIFLAGPIQGAFDWHEEAIKFLIENSDAIIACPKRKIGIEKNEIEYNKQVEWESKYLNAAAFKGYGILFWLPNEKEKIEGRSYAQTTRFELGEWYTYYQHTCINLAVGIEDGFPGRRYISKKFDNKIKNNLIDTCKEFLKI